MKLKPVKEGQRLEIKAPNLQMATFTIKGDAPYVQHKFGEKVKEEMRRNHEAGSTTKKGKNREPKDFDLAFRHATHRGPKGEYGIPASALRSAMISACKMVGYAMTRAKLALMIVADFYSVGDNTPMIRLKQEPKMDISPVRNSDGSPDLRARPMWNPGWSTDVTVRFDADQFQLSDVANLMLRVGLQVGIGEGRNDSKKSAGCGWGSFIVLDKAPPKRKAKK